MNLPEALEQLRLQSLDQSKPKYERDRAERTLERIMIKNAKKIIAALRKLPA